MQILTDLFKVLVHFELIVFCSVEIDQTGELRKRTLWHTFKLRTVNSDVFIF